MLNRVSLLASYMWLSIDIVPKSESGGSLGTGTYGEVYLVSMTSPWPNS